MLKLILRFYEQGLERAGSGRGLSTTLVALPVRERIGRYKYIHEEQVDGEFDEIQSQLIAEIAARSEREGGVA